MIARLLTCRCGMTFTRAAALKRHEPFCRDRCSSCNALPPRHVPGCELAPKPKPTSPAADPRQLELGW